MPLLEIKNLNISSSTKHLVNNINLSIDKNKTLGIVGESGSGKSLTSLSIMRLLHKNLNMSGEIYFEEKNLNNLSEKKLQALRGNDISMIFQEPMTSLNPLHTIYKQLYESVKIHNNYSKKMIDKKIAEILSLVNLSMLIDRKKAYPHELSGGQRQRVMIAMALINNPKLLIADEPTTALDVTVQNEILLLLNKLKEKLGLSILFISHDLSVIRKICDDVIVMKSGDILEQGTVEQIFTSPHHKYTQKLLYDANFSEIQNTSPSDEQILEISQLTVKYPLKRNIFGLVSRYHLAVDNASMQLHKSETIGIIGESGSGKTTIVMSLLKLNKALLTGDINFAEDNISSNKDFRKYIQIVLQDPYSSLNPRMNIKEIIAEGAIEHNIYSDEKLHKTIKSVGLDKNILNRYPHEFSGGQRQRIAIARALMVDPKVIIFDEPTSALDASTKIEIINLIKNLQKEKDISYIVISHDISTIKSLSHNIIVMQNGKIIESNNVHKILNNPQNKLTKELVS